MQNATIKATAAALTVLSLIEFLEAYPFNLEQMERENDDSSKSTELLVSNREENFTIGFSPFTINGEDATAKDFILRVANGDESVADDWNMHVDRFVPDNEYDERAEVSGQADVSDYGPDDLVLPWDKYGISNE